LIALPGGVELTAQSSGNLWSYPNLQGDYVATTNQSGVVQGSVVTYDPFGAVYPKATAPADISGGATLGASGADGKLQENALPTTIVFMGARIYSPGEGRFLSVDPIEGGCANAYVYVRGDPINQEDLNGQNYCYNMSAQKAVKWGNALELSGEAAEDGGDVPVPILSEALEAFGIGASAFGAALAAAGEEAIQASETVPGSIPEVQIYIPTIRIFGANTGIPYDIRPIPYLAERTTGSGGGGSPTPASRTCPV
jgi:RHS repeat-associated protein